MIYFKSLGQTDPNCLKLALDHQMISQCVSQISVLVGLVPSQDLDAAPITSEPLETILASTRLHEIKNVSSYFVNISHQQQPPSDNVLTLLNRLIHEPSDVPPSPHSQPLFGTVLELFDGLVPVLSARVLQAMLGALASNVPMNSAFLL